MADNNIVSALYRPKRLAILTAAAGFILFGVSVLLIYLISKQNPSDTSAKVLNCAAFVITWCIGLLSAAMSVSAIRDFFSRPTITLYSDRLVFHDGTEISFKEIKSMHQNKKRLYNSELIFILSNDAEVSVKQKTIDVPLQTLKCAVEARI